MLRVAFASAALAALTIGTSLRAEVPPPIACSVEQAPEGFSAELYEFLNTPKDASSQEGLVMEKFAQIIEKCIDEKELETDRGHIIGFGMMMVHLKIEAQSRLNALGYDPTQIDAVMVPGIKDLTIEEILSDFFTPLEALRPKAEGLVEDATRQTGLDREKLTDLLASYSAGLLGEIAVEQVY